MAKRKPTNSMSGLEVLGKIEISSGDTESCGNSSHVTGQSHPSWASSQAKKEIRGTLDVVLNDLDEAMKNPEFFGFTIVYNDHGCSPGAGRNGIRIEVTYSDDGYNQIAEGGKTTNKYHRIPFSEEFPFIGISQIIGDEIKLKKRRAEYY